MPCSRKVIWYAWQCNRSVSASNPSRSKISALIATGDSFRDNFTGIDGIIQLRDVSAIKKAWLIEPGLFALSLCVSFRRAEPVAPGNHHGATEPASSIVPFAD